MYHFISDGNPSTGFRLSSFARTIELAPLLNKRLIYRLLAADARRQCDLHFQLTVDGLWEIAEQSGLVALVGIGVLQDDLGCAFGGER